MADSSTSDFITNEDGNTLVSRLNKLIRDTTQFDILVGYFYISGFYEIYKSLEDVDEIKILIGLDTEKKVIQAVNQNLEFSYEPVREVKNSISNKYLTEVAEAEDKADVEEGMLKFIEWLKNGKLKIKIYDQSPLHAKMYIFTFEEGSRDPGRVITGSSNLTRSGLSKNLEFNVELRSSGDYAYAKDRFDSLWEESVDISETIIDTIEKKTHLNDEITPYQLYLKFLYEYFKEDLELEEDIEDFTPEGYLELEYQKQAVINAKKILEEYGGVFISDVVGLGKTYITARLLNSVGGKTLVIAPPALISKENPGSWTNVLMEFGVRGFECESVGLLQKIIDRGVKKFDNIVIDESHNFRNDANITFAKLAEICRGKKVILVSATPFNNQPKDLLSQISLFQNSRKSTIPGLPNLEYYFSKLQSKLNKLDRKMDYTKYRAIVKDNAKSIRERVLKYLMVRRTRTEITKYYSEDLKKQGLKFPEVKDPQPVYYQFDDLEDVAFNKTLSFIDAFKYSRYTPLLFFTGVLDERQKQSQRNLLTFMKMLLLKRFESSIFAFRKTLDRFVRSYELMIREFDKGNVYVSKKDSNKLFQLLDEDRIEDILDLMDKEKVERYDSNKFEDSFKTYLESDLALLIDLRNTWSKITRDVKLETFIKILKTKKVLKENKLIIFTESKETAEYLSSELEKELGEEVLNFTGGSAMSLRQEVINNFDARAFKKEDKYRILVTTEVLAEGVSLHRSNVVINYDIPWNPTRLMQRVGRINRVDTKFEEIYSYNFFPSVQSNDVLKLKEAAALKIGMFVDLLGADAKLLTSEDEIKSNELFDKLLSKETIIGEEEEGSELQYLTKIKEIRDEDKKLFREIQTLPPKSRSARRLSSYSDTLLTYFKKDEKLDKFILSEKNGAMELGFMDAIKLFECEEDTKRVTIPKSFYEKIKQNKEYFDLLIAEESMEAEEGRTRSKNEKKVLKRLKAKSIRFSDEYMDSQKEYLELVIQKIEVGAFPKNTVNKIWEKIQNVMEPLVIVNLLKNLVSENLLGDTYAQQNKKFESSKEVILSEYFE